MRVGKETEAITIGWTATATFETNSSMSQWRNNGDECNYVMVWCIYLGRCMCVCRKLSCILKYWAAVCASVTEEDAVRDALKGADAAARPHWEAEHYRRLWINWQRCKHAEYACCFWRILHVWLLKMIFVDVCNLNLVSNAWQKTSTTHKMLRNNQACLYQRFKDP